MVVPTLLRDGDNRVELYQVEGEPGSERLRPVPLEGADR
jgi:hypothetical protein